MTRAERRFKNQIIYDRRAKLFFRTHLTDVECDVNDMPIHYRNRYHYCRKFPKRPAETWKDLQENSRSMHLYKNTRTIWRHNYWDKWEMKLMNKRSRLESRLKIKQYDDRD